MPDLEDEQSQQVELLTSIILEYVVSVTRLDMNVQKRFNLESNLGIIGISGACRLYDTPRWEMR
ncbi:hypothetical protein L915_20081, partial [Phytophthora nicotianae]